MVIISNGFGQFHLAVADTEAQRRGILTSLITGAYPTPIARAALVRSGLARTRKLARLAARRQQIPDEMVRSLWAADAVYSSAIALKRFADPAASRLTAASFRYYGRSAVRHVREAAARGARIYHYRSGFGQQSVAEAKRSGMVAICDHSIAHPALLEALVDHDGVISHSVRYEVTDPMWLEVMKDLEQADVVLVNSEFVRDTFHLAGFRGAPIFVIHLGVDDAYLDAVPERGASRGPDGGPLRMLFAGGFSRRKGAHTVLAALKNLNGINWNLEIAGNLETEFATNEAIGADLRISCLGWLSRRDLAARMAATEVFIFPSLAEGSARVVFEALAAGCYVITTPNSGSIVEDGVHGRLIPPGDAHALASAIREAAKRRPEVASIGRRNAALVRAKYRQRDYGDKLAGLYDELLSHRQSGAVAV